MPPTPASLPTAAATAVRARYITPALSVFVVTATGEPACDGALRPANGGLRLLPYPSDGACLADGRRLAGLMADKHGIYGTGFAGGKVVARAPDPQAAKGALLRATGLLLESLGGAMVTGCDLNTNPGDMARLARLTPHVLAAIGSRIDASSCTAHGTLGALEAVQRRPGTALVHGCGAVGGVVARELIARGWRVFSVDLDPARSAIPGARPLDPHSPWWSTQVDVLLPCSSSGLLGAAQVRQLQANALVSAANAPFRQPDGARALEERGVLVLPDPLVNAGAVIADSIERYAPEAWSQAEPEAVYAFVAAAVRRRSERFLAHLRAGSEARVALGAVAAPAGEAPIGTRFASWVAG
ncbi:MAG: Glu/Leu/Phe/Val dehydrogenase dimerization domain-containing protein [Cyanobium sp.]